MTAQQAATPEQATPDQAKVIHDLLNAIEDIRDCALWECYDINDPLASIVRMLNEALAKFGRADFDRTWLSEAW